MENYGKGCRKYQTILRNIFTTISDNNKGNQLTIYSDRGYLDHIRTKNFVYNNNIKNFNLDNNEIF